MCFTSLNSDIVCHVIIGGVHVGKDRRFSLWERLFFVCENMIITCGSGSHVKAEIHLKRVRVRGYMNGFCFS